MPESGRFASGDENIVHIPGNGRIETVLRFKEPEVILGKGEKYKVKASGNWMGVWLHGEGKGGDEGFSVDDEGCRRGEWQSNEIVVEVPGESTTDL